MLNTTLLLHIYGHQIFVKNCARLKVWWQFHSHASVINHRFFHWFCSSHLQPSNQQESHSFFQKPASIKSEKPLFLMFYQFLVKDTCKDLKLGLQPLCLFWTIESMFSPLSRQRKLSDIPVTSINCSFSNKTNIIDIGRFKCD